MQGVGAPIPTRSAALRAVFVIPAACLNVGRRRRCRSRRRSSSATVDGLRADDEAVRRGAYVVERVAGDERERGFRRRVEDGYLGWRHDAGVADDVGEVAVRSGDANVIAGADVLQRPEEGVAMGGKRDVAGVAGQRRVRHMATARLSVRVSTPSRTIAETPSRGISMRPTIDRAARGRRAAGDEAAAVDERTAGDECAAGDDGAAGDGR